MHVFDGTYGDAAPLIAWARKRIARGATDSAMTVLYIPGSGTAPQAQRVAKEVCAALVSADPALKERFRVESTRTGHNDIPQVFGWRLLVDPAAPLPGATRRSCGSGRSGELEALDETGEAVHASYAELEQDLASVGDESEDLVWPFATTKPTTPGKDRARGVVTYSRPTATDAKKAHPGTLKLAQMWKRLSGIKAGTYNYRLTTFGTRSAHGEGRAIDCYAKASVPAERMMAEAFIEWMQDNAVELQVSVIIWNKRIWAWHRRAQGWRHYRGNPPTDHIHVELSWEGALHPSPLFDTTPFSVTPYGQVVKAVGRGIGGVAGVRGMFEDEELEAEGFDTEGFTLELFEPESFEPESFELFEPEDLLLDLDAEEEAGGRWSAQEGPDLEEESDRGRGVVRRGAFRACAGKAQPGAKALAGQRTRWTGRKAGIYNCRATVFGSPSLHGEGRAVDCYARADDPAQRRQAETYVAWLTANAVELQVAVVIWKPQDLGLAPAEPGLAGLQGRSAHRPHPRRAQLGGCDDAERVVLDGPVGCCHRTESHTRTRAQPVSGTSPHARQEGHAGAVRPAVCRPGSRQPRHPRGPGARHPRAGGLGVRMGPTCGGLQLLRDQGQSERPVRDSSAVADKGSAPHAEREVPRGHLGHAACRWALRLRGS